MNLFEIVIVCSGIIVLSICLYSVYSFIFDIRSKKMEGISKRLGLNFIKWRDDLKNNYMSGNYNGHSVIIFDIYTSRLWWRYFGKENLIPSSATHISIDGKHFEFPELVKTNQIVNIIENCILKGVEKGVEPYFKIIRRKSIFQMIIILSIFGLLAWQIIKYGNLIRAL